MAGELCFPSSVTCFSLRGKEALGRAGSVPVRASSGAPGEPVRGSEPGCPGAGGAPRLARSSAPGLAGAAGATGPAGAHPASGEGLCCEPVRRAGACGTPGCLSQAEGSVCQTRSEPSCPCSEQRRAGLGKHGEPSVPKAFLPRSWCKQRPRSPGHVGAGCCDWLETGDVVFRVPHLVLLFSSASAFRNELLSVSPLHKTACFTVS